MGRRRPWQFWLGRPEVGEELTGGTVGPTCQRGEEGGGGRQIDFAQGGKRAGPRERDRPA